MRLAHDKDWAELISRDMTIANIRERSDRVDVMFLESARIYKLPRAHPRFARMYQLLQDAREAGRLVKVMLASAESETIEDVRAG